MIYVVLNTCHYFYCCVLLMFTVTVYEPYAANKNKTCIFKHLLIKEGLSMIITDKQPYVSAKNTRMPVVFQT